MKRGEVWWVSFNPALGSEIQKTRPAVIISNDISNKAIDRVQVMPITSNVHRIYLSDAVITLNNKKGKVMANQIRTVSKIRVQSYISTVLPEEMMDIERALKVQLAL